MADSETIRVVLGEPLKGEWGTVLQARKISQQKAIVSLLGWVVKQDPLLQAMLFGQVPETDHAALSRMVLKRLPAVAPTAQHLVTSDAAKVFAPGGAKKKGK